MYGLVDVFFVYVFGVVDVVFELFVDVVLMVVFFDLFFVVEFDFVDK